jgi:hypothetical protein
MTQKEYVKNYKRVHDIMRKADGDKEKAIKLATTQANRISVDNKAISRYRVAKDEGFDDISTVFMDRALDLNQVDTKEARNYKIEQLLKD